MQPLPDNDDVYQMYTEQHDENDNNSDNEENGDWGSFDKYVSINMFGKEIKIIVKLKYF